MFSIGQLWLIGLIFVLTYYTGPCQEVEARPVRAMTGATPNARSHGNLDGPEAHFIERGNARTKRPALSVSHGKCALAIVPIRAGEMHAAIEFHIEGLRLSGDEIPAPRSKAAYCEIAA